MPPVSARHDFKPAQRQALALLRDGRETALTRGAYEALCGVSRSQAAYDLAELVEAGALERVGGGRTTHYVLVREPNSTRRHWTSERIHAELAHFCAGRSAWPSAREFKAAGRGDLYVAASRYGGIAFWAAELGLARTHRWEAPSIPRLRLSVSWAIIGALGGALGVGAAVAIVQGLPGGTPAPVAQQTRSTAASNTPSAKKSQAKASQPRTRKASPPAATAKAKAVPSSTHRSQPVAARSSGSGTAVLATRTVSSASAPAPSSPTSRATSSSRTARTTSSSSPSSGPTPIMAPMQTGSGTPPPLPPPTP
jgi:hypothetical protein